MTKSTVSRLVGPSKEEVREKVLADRPEYFWGGCDYFGHVEQDRRRTLVLTSYTQVLLEGMAKRSWRLWLRRKASNGNRD